MFQILKVKCVKNLKRVRTWVCSKQVDAASCLPTSNYTNRNTVMKMRAPEKIEKVSFISPAKPSRESSPSCKAHIFSKDHFLQGPNPQPSVLTRPRNSNHKLKLLLNPFSAAHTHPPHLGAVTCREERTHTQGKLVRRRSTSENGNKTSFDWDSERKSWMFWGTWVTCSHSSPGLLQISNQESVFQDALRAQGSRSPGVRPLQHSEHFLTRTAFGRDSPVVWSQLPLYMSALHESYPPTPTLPARFGAETPAFIVTYA